MKNWLYEKSAAIFFVTLAVYIIIWCTVSYMGVYVTYVAGPLLVVSGVTMWLSSPKDEKS